MYNNVTQLYIYIYSFFFRFFSHIGYHWMLSGFPLIYFYTVLLLKVYFVKLENKWTPDLKFVIRLNTDKCGKEAIDQWDILNKKEEINHVSLKLPVVLDNKLWTKPHHSHYSGVTYDSQLGANWRIPRSQTWIGCENIQGSQMRDEECD